MTAISLRPGAPADAPLIHALTNAAFRGTAHGNGMEAEIIAGLRAAGDLSLSLVAEDGTAIVGHIAISPVTISDGSQHWFGLGPVSVTPDLQRQGIGFRLVTRAIADMRAQGAHGLVLLGDPEYYGRFGFVSDPALAYPGPPAGYFQHLLMAGEMPRGTVRYAPAFTAA